ncbi:hypothetical protein [Aneurinibacillus aneurinilyticus]|uniref:Lipoprotein n=1 Tax=Aneurinibacillus aneurinilyticus TaxID=1391 RepID=A0A848D4C9_ANEAE|nr:hypothetical protein [Aneurinibacillus aneurinilyticus]NMF00541.1 hypothetical protein [Aneurinibacillus aneurinilyticus]
MKKWGYGVAGAALAVIIGTLSTGAAAPAQPGSDADPVVTKSYVEQIRQDILNQVKGQSGSGTQSPAPGSGSATLVVEKVEEGSTVIGYAGTELILRTGKAVAQTPAGDGYGLPDLTAGTNITKGKNVPANHHLLLPQNDERGLKVVKGPAYVMIRGAYVIK